MQEIRMSDGRLFRSFMAIPGMTAAQAHEEQVARLKADIEAGEVESVKTVEITDENKPCPCGSGRRFRYCCANRINQGPQVQTAAQRRAEDGRLQRARETSRSSCFARRGRGPTGSGKLGQRKRCELGIL